MLVFYMCARPLHDYRLCALQVNVLGSVSPCVLLQQAVAKTRPSHIKKTLNPKPLKPQTLNPLKAPNSLNPKPYTLNPITLNPLKHLTPRTRSLKRTFRQGPSMAQTDRSHEDPISA